MKLKDVPNLLSLLRILLVPVFIGEFLKSKYISCFIVFVISGISDVADGYIARKHACESSLGRILDPIADKLTYATVFFCLFSQGKIPAFFVVTFVIVGLLQAIGAIFVYKTKKTVVKSNIPGKLAGFSMFAFSAILLMFEGNLSGAALNILSLAVAGAIVIALAAYFYRYIIDEFVHGTTKEDNNR